MMGAPFPGSSQPTAVLINTQNNGLLNGTFTLPATTAMSVVVLIWQTNTGNNLTSVTIGGHAATITNNNIGGIAIAAAMVSPSDPNTFSEVGAVIFSGRAGVYVYRVDGVAGVNAILTSTMPGAAPTATVNIPANTSIISAANGQAGSTPTMTWSGITGQTQLSQSQHAESSGVDNYAIASPSHVVKCTIAPVVAATGELVIFAP